MDKQLTSQDAKEFADFLGLTSEERDAFAERLGMRIFRCFTKRGASKEGVTMEIWDA